MSREALAATHRRPEWHVEPGVDDGGSGRVREHGGAFTGNCDGGYGRIGESSTSLFIDDVLCGRGRLPWPRRTRSILYCGADLGILKIFLVSSENHDPCTLSPASVYRPSSNDAALSMSSRLNMVLCIGGWEADK